MAPYALSQNFMIVVLAFTPDGMPYFRYHKALVGILYRQKELKALSLIMNLTY